MRTPPGPCLYCGNPATPPTIRRLHLSCYSKVQRAGQLEDYPRVTKPRRDVLEDYEILAREGYTIRNAAERLGMTHKALDQALTRARRQGVKV